MCKYVADGSTLYFCVSMLRMAVRCLCVSVCCGWQYAVYLCQYVADGSTLYLCVSMLRMAVCLSVSVCCQKRGKKERGKENSMEGEDNVKQGEGKR